MSIRNCQHHENITQTLSSSDTKHSKIADYQVADFPYIASWEHPYAFSSHLDKYKLQKYWIFYTLSGPKITEIANIVKILSGL